MDLKSLKDIPASFVLAKRSLLFGLIISILISTGSFVWAFFITNKMKNNAYVLTKEGQVALMQNVNASDVDAYRKPEMINHIRMFHTAFWQVDQFNYKRSIDRALHLAGASGKQLFKTLEANGHFAKISTQNLTQKIVIDSIKVNDLVSPYQGSFYGKLHVLRTDQKATKSINQISARFVMYNVSRTNKNPHGLLIENYYLDSKPL